MITHDVLATIEGSKPPILGAFIGGVNRSPGDDTFDVRNPATGHTIARVEEVGAAGVAAAVDAGKAASDGWRHTSPRDRAALIGELGRRVSEHADELARLAALDSSNPVTAMRGDVTKGVRVMGDVAGVALQVKGDRTVPISSRPW